MEPKPYPYAASDGSDLPAAASLGTEPRNLPLGEQESMFDNPKELSDLFQYHPPSQAGVTTHGILSGQFIELARIVDSHCPNGREKSVAMRKLEEAKMWASAGVARNPITR